MTIKEIGEMANVSKSTVLRKVKELFPEVIQENKCSRLNKEQSIKVVEQIKKMGYIQPLQNESQPLQNESHSYLSQKDIEIISLIVSKTVSETIKTLDNRMSNLENKYEEKKALLPAPQLSDRENLRMIINSYSKRKNINHSVVWGKLYQESYYRLNINLRERAENRGLSIIDYVEKENLISELLSIATEIFI